MSARRPVRGAEGLFLSGCQHPDRPAELGPAVALDPCQQAPHDAALAFAQASVALSLQHRLDEGMDRILLADGEADASVALDELDHLRQAQAFQILHAERYSPAACTLLGASVSDSAG
jgi:hypothetical protein